MKVKISDFKFAELILKKLCKQSGSAFVDLDVCFDNDDVPQVRSDCIVTSESKHVGQTIYKLISAYANNVKEIDGKTVFSDDSQKEQFLIATASFLRHLVYGNNSKPDSFHAMRLYQNPLVWTILKDLICPVWDAHLLNHQVITGPNPYVDIASFRDKNSIEDGKPEKPFIFVNSDVVFQPVRDVYVLLEAITACGLNPDKVIRDILESELSDKLFGIVELEFDQDDDLAAFMSTLIWSIGYELEDFGNIQGIEKIASKKIAQLNLPSWWYFGILEKLIEPMRGADWTTYETLEPYVRNFWDKVERFKQSKNIKEDGVPFDTLLRIKWEDHKTDATQTIQSLLSSDRIW